MQLEFMRAMDDDFNTAGAVAALFEALPTVNRFMDERGIESTISDGDRKTLDAFVASLRFLGRLLGIFEAPVEAEAGLDEAMLAALRTILGDLGADASGDADAMVRRLIDLRAAARKEKNFQRADEIRNRLNEASIVLEDRPGGTTWSVAT
jgi:cysteinyl-tRNA synthetase